ncbi:MAG: alkene reductase [Sphingorhabdus sp.]
MTEKLFEPIALGALEMANRIIMAPMTRDRAGPHDVPTDLMVEYYRQRASAGLIVTEGTQPSREGKGYWRTPGIYSQEQIDGWAKVAEAVHGEGGKLVMQIMHCGRVVVSDNREYDADVIAPSAIACGDKVPGPDGVPTETAMPRGLETDEMPALIQEFAQAAKNARAAGIDGVELHCASGYLVHQFLNSRSNQREDQWGGAVENRIRFPVAILQAMADAIGGDRVGFRISPGNPYNDVDVSDPEATFAPFLKAANDLGLAYVHVVDMGLEGLEALSMIRDNWSGPIITNNGLKADSANAILAAGRAEAVSFGRAFIANPDLVERIRDGVALAKPDYMKLYTGEAEGYIDYPRAGE